MKEEYHKEIWFIVALSILGGAFGWVLWWLALPFWVIATVLAVVRILDDRRSTIATRKLEAEFDSLKANLDATSKNFRSQREYAEKLREYIDSLGANAYEELQRKIAAAGEDLSALNSRAVSLRTDIENLEQRSREASEKSLKESKRLEKLKELYKVFKASVDRFRDVFPDTSSFEIPDSGFDEAELLAPSVELKLHALDIKDLNKAFRENEKRVEECCARYESRYTTKANAAIYKLMTIALRAEIQNVLIALRYEKLDDALDKIKSMTAKFMEIAGTGNASIMPTLVKFVGEIEYLFALSAKIEYNYYVKKEQARAEQLAIREKMREEAAERKALEAERAKVAAEEEKFNRELEKLREQQAVQAKSDEEKAALEARIRELEGHLSDVAVKREEIAKLQNGKAGNVYIISNLGSFGEDVFKVGMTRRMDPQERVDELGDASVPFEFDVHSFIFSEDAVGLEKRLHEILSSKRVNKVNLRKEFFRTSVDELQALVQEIEPTAEFTRTMAAEEYRASLASDEDYTSEKSNHDEEPGD